ncbi:MAG: acyl-CoA dehydrogenase [Betaproteobacteria bacterium]|nr:acyl-CoA dehydrogenase [Betaproteobacteria bacterium]
MQTLLYAGAFIAVMWALAYFRAVAMVWTVLGAAALIAIGYVSATSIVVLTLAVIIFLIVALLLNPGPIRRAVLGGPLLDVFRKVLPEMSNTEKEAIEAGTVWWDGELFSGKPNWKKLLAYPKPRLSAEEQAFLDGPVEQLCAMVDEWEITHELHDLPREAWQFIKDQGFLGMIIPKEYGGKGFSALAHSAVIVKLTSRSGTAAVSVMVPNSLGPAELLLHYGTAAQKDHYLPRLAKGLEMPCFALTSPEAGSDAGGIPDFGVVCRGQWQGEPNVLGIRLTWEKRYITLGPVATLLGLAFRLYDPDHILGSNEDLGITLGLIPTDTPGVNIGRRHFPLNGAFMNGPNWGKDVFVPMDYVIGGVEYAGQGWKMLMNCLAAGRSISLPGSSVGMSKLAARTTGGYGRVRTQFKTSIGRFEGVEEAMARIAGNVYLMDAARVMTAGAVDLGEKPSVISAIVKYHITERGRQVINDAMDVHGGKGICMGPNNYLGRAYQQIPVAITVEGANILTRSMIIFGQGAIRGHPYVLKEMQSVHDPDEARALREFDKAFFGHIAFAVSNKARASWMGFTGGRLVLAPGDRHTRRYYRQLTRLSAAFAWVADVSMFVVGGALKRRERLSARLGDILSQLYLASCVLKRYEDDGRPQEDLPLVHWSLQDALYRAQEAFYGLFENLPGRLVGKALRLTVFPYGRVFDEPRDRLGSEVVGLLMTPGPSRERLTAGMCIPQDENDPVTVIDLALQAVIAAEPVEAKMRAAAREGAISGEFADLLAADALAKGVITREEADTLARAKALRRKAVMVDDFPKDFGRSEIVQSTQAVSFEALARP